MTNKGASINVRRTVPRHCRFFLICISLTVSSFSAEWQPVRETLILFNTDSPSSASLAKVYASLREIPEDRVIGLPLSNDETITRREFESTLREPLLREFTDRKWWTIEQRDLTDPNGSRYGHTEHVVKQSIRVVVIMRGVPLRVKRSPAGSKGQEHADEASVDSEIAALGLPDRKLQGIVENRYYQSTRRFPDHEQALGQLLVGRLDAADDATVRRMMQDTIKAERDGLWGRAVIDFSLMRAGYQEGEQWLDQSVTTFREAGIPVFTDCYKEVLREAWPLPDTILYFGWYASQCKGAFATPDFRFQPGAIASHLHSFSAASLRDRTKHWCAPLLDRGAAATLGNVWEPYLSLTIHFDLFNARLLEGFTLGEAAWSATPGLSWMSVVIGDPLYRPFAKPRVMMSDEPAALDYALFHDLAVRFLPHDGKKFRLELLRIAEGKQSPRLLELASLVSATDRNFGQASDFLQHAAALYENPEDKLRCSLYEAELARRGGDAQQSLALVKRIMEESQFGSIPAISAAMGMQKEMAPK